MERLTAIKNIFKINSDVRLGESFHITGSPRSEVIAGNEGSLCSVTFMSIDDWGNELLCGATASSADLLLKLLEEIESNLDSEELDDCGGLSVVSMYAIHGKESNYKVNLCYDEYYFNTIDSVIEFLTN
ncbi:hypothetical protein S14_213 [Shewanella sp. phage 1/4]|uniref:hypothetical protein n=1 Tax=Shewanella phage 1/4 TaxID=1458859 RepID=UPI0004F73731|nr:hypothetical protein S14_213 [Shewanella sp. phage 1/4]AHK11322.1 hypothetical protein S14_213 [Shewanella sp. phage 1/4]